MYAGTQDTTLVLQKEIERRRKKNKKRKKIVC